MVELFKHILHLDFEWLFATYGTLIYVVLFLVIFIETGVVAMPFLPGDSLLFTAGLFCVPTTAGGVAPLSLPVLIGLLLVAAILGDNCNYWIGRKCYWRHRTKRNIIQGKVITTSNSIQVNYGKVCCC